MVAQPGTVTILFTDLVNSTRLMQRAGDEDAQRIFKAHYQLLRDAVSANGGSEVKVGINAGEPMNEGDHYFGPPAVLTVTRAAVPAVPVTIPRAPPTSCVLAFTVSQTPFYSPLVTGPARRGQ